ncbi:MAG: chemotaxis protein CheW [Rhodospirillales bacterium]|nr:chemotaxis protein CheW [Rhodospirillales bacterium]
MNQLALTDGGRRPDALLHKVDTFVTMSVGDQIFGIPVGVTRDILVPNKIYHIPLTRDEVAGSVNLRGRIVTVIDMRARLRLGRTANKDQKGHRCVTVEYKGELYSLLIDGIGDIMELSTALFEPLPTTLKQEWKDVCKGVYRLDNKILVILDIERFLDI